MHFGRYGEMVMYKVVFTKQSMKDLENSVVTFEETQTINLQNGSDNKAHYAMLDGYTLSVNKNAKI